MSGYKLTDEFLSSWLENYKEYDKPPFTFQEEIISNFNIDISNGFYDEFIKNNNLKVKKEIELSHENRYYICNYSIIDSYKKLDKLCQHKAN